MSFAPLVQICAPPGTGKSTVVPHLVALSNREVIVDIDEILTDGALLGIPIASAAAAPLWPEYDRLWLRIAAIVRRSGHPVIMFVQVPDEDGFGPDVDDPTKIMLGWQVSDTVRASRLRARGWDAEQIHGAAADAHLMADMLPAERLVTSPEGEEAGVSAERLLAAVRRLLDSN